ncbi:MAG: 2-amino-4-hydroxy-6-hydroxymethyldihydropteridine diphosphokinase [Planctomycetia bacterium]|nr:2-amino-4-hydroxy-6-hydroxymethyldihydropteridine diphosphokinase [Planctomycetia bacterium]
MTTCLISLGGNLGDVALAIDDALRRLQRNPEIGVLQRSSLFRTQPVGADAGSEFVNAAAELETSLTAHQLLGQLLAIETELGRVRTIHWGPRTLDLDLLFFGNAVINDSPRLIVPHPMCWYRRFVLDPLAEIAPHFVHPGKHVSVVELLRRLLVRPLPICLVGDAKQVEMLIADLQPKFPNADLRCCHRLRDAPANDAGLVIQLAPITSSTFAVWSHHIVWLDASGHPDRQHQDIADILCSAGL